MSSRYTLIDKFSSDFVCGVNLLFDDAYAMARQLTGAKIVMDVKQYDAENDKWEYSCYNAENRNLEFVIREE